VFLTCLAVAPAALAVSPVAVTSPSVVEGDAGQVNLVFTISGSCNENFACDISYSTADGSASTVFGDYQATTGSFNSLTCCGAAFSQQVSVPITGDFQVEADETLTLSATVTSNNNFAGSGSGVGTILNDDAALPPFTRGFANQVTSTTTPRRDRFRPYTFTTRGRIVPPPKYCAPGMSPTPSAGNCVPIICPAGAMTVAGCQPVTRPPLSVICSGVVTVRFQKRGTTVSSRNVSVRPDCTYRSRVSFRTRLLSRQGSLRVRSRFQGNGVLLPRNSAVRNVRAG